MVPWQYVVFSGRLTDVVRANSQSGMHGVELVWSLQVSSSEKEDVG